MTWHDLVGSVLAALALLMTLTAIVGLVRGAELLARVLRSAIRGK